MKAAEDPRATTDSLPQTDDPASRPLPGSAKIGPHHRERLALVYVRQSSPHQVRHHRESRQRQYALADSATALGWPRQRVLVIDDDQGQTSQRPTEARQGFQRVVAAVRDRKSVV